jgi:sarcosine oxidase subunit gamma
VAELITRTPAQGLVPVAAPGALLTEAAPAPIWSVAPFRGQGAALSAALERAHGLPLPAPGTMHAKGALRVAWAGRDMAFLMGATPDAALAAHAALTDQSDGWAHLVLEGSAARDVLARLVPIDLAPVSCPAGAARRTLLGHMAALILHPGGDRFEMLVFRSMAGSAVQDLTRAMRAVAARGAPR